MVSFAAFPKPGGRERAGLLGFGVVCLTEGRTSRYGFPLSELRSVNFSGFSVKVMPTTNVRPLDGDGEPFATYAQRSNCGIARPTWISAKRAAALVLHRDPAAHVACRAAGNDQISDPDSVAMSLKVLRDFFALEAVSSIYREASVFCILNVPPTAWISFRADLIYSAVKLRRACKLVGFAPRYFCFDLAYAGCVSFPLR